MLAGCFVAVAPSFAHISEQGFILLLPTDMYINFGVAAVGLTVAVLAILPAKKSLGLFVHKTLELAQRPAVAVVTSLASLAFLALLVFTGFQGPRDPLGNLLPLVIWTVWWVGFVIVQGLFGDFWHWLNPWTGFYRLVQDALGTGKKFTLPSWLGAWPGVVTLNAVKGDASLAEMVRLVKEKGIKAVDNYGMFGWYLIAREEAAAGNEAKAFEALRMAMSYWSNPPLWNVNIWQQDKRWGDLQGHPEFNRIFDEKRNGIGPVFGTLHYFPGW